MNFRRLGIIILAVLAIFLGVHLVTHLMLSKNDEFPVSDELETAPGLSHYKLSDGYGYYRSAIPPNFSDDSPLVIYYHGAGADENQGLDKLARVRKEFEARGYGYISPRYYEFQQLRKHLLNLHGPRDIYLIGGSRGGREVLEELIEHPNSYEGAILLCPAILDVEANYDLSNLTTPILVAVGDADGISISGSHELAEKCTTVELFIIPNGDHSSPYLAGGEAWLELVFSHVFSDSINRPTK
ncbi:MAG: hypothetical protein AAF585_09910 [Verrucomicrobiota bacterium]